MKWKEEITRPEWEMNARRFPNSACSAIVGTAEGRKTLLEWAAYLRKIQERRGSLRELDE